jgi:hypothetical protein
MALGSELTSEIQAFLRKFQVVKNPGCVAKIAAELVVYSV